MKTSKVILIIQPIVMYLTSIALYLLSFLGNQMDEGLLKALEIITLVGVVFSILITLTSTVFSLFNIKQNAECPYKTVMFVKLILIPWFIANFYFCLLLIGGFLNPFLLATIPLLICIEVIATYIQMISISLHSIVYYFASLIREKKKAVPLQLVSVIFHFFFCLDVVGAVMLFLKTKTEQEKLKEIPKSVN